MSICVDPPVMGDVQVLPFGTPHFERRSFDPRSKVLGIVIYHITTLADIGANLCQLNLTLQDEFGVWFHVFQVLEDWLKMSSDDWDSWRSLSHDVDEMTAGKRRKKCAVCELTVLYRLCIGM
jgi:hypothetical protein